MMKLQFLILFLAYLAINAQNDNYCELTCGREIHTVCLREALDCGPGPSCGEHYELIELTDEDRQLILDLHNSLRNKVASGTEKIGPQPPASNMHALSYNKELEYIAQCLTNGCQYRHDRCRKTQTYNWVGQNIAKTSFRGTLGSYRNVINSSIAMWYNEVKNFNPAWTKAFQRFPKVVGHYTQVVWANTREIGCGITSWRGERYNNYFMACNYGPGGNFITRPIYEVGKPASKCPGGNVNQKYPALCGTDNLN